MVQSLARSLSRPVRSAGSLARASGWLIAAGGSVAVAGGFSAAQGGYFATSWGWCTLILCWIAGLALVLMPRTRFSSLEVGVLVALAGYTCWTAVSVAWSADPPQAVLDAERRLIYLIGLLALLLVVGKKEVHRVLGGLLVGITVIAAYALSTRLFPATRSASLSVQGKQLAGPIGYWNGLAVLTVMGLLLALGFAARGRSTLTRAAAAAVLPVLIATLYFTYSRGGWIALAVGLLAVVVFDARRLQLVTAGLVLTLPAAAAVWLGSDSRALTALRASYQTTRHDGRMLALELIALASTSAALAVGLTMVEQRVKVGRSVRIACGIALSGASLAVIGALVIGYGGPERIAHKVSRSVQNPPISVRTTGDFNSRLFTLSSNGRLDEWRAAWHDFDAHRWLGSGSGSFESYWFEHRPIHFKVRDAHSLYIETLAELGPIGLGLLLVALGLPLIAAVRVRRSHLISATFAAYAAFLAHAAVDWDWELAAIALTAILLAGVLLVAARGQARAFSLGRPSRAALVVAVVAVGAFSVVSLVGNRALASATHAVSDGNWRKAESQAHLAIRWAPWSSEAWQLLGNAQLALGRRSQAAASLRKAAEINPNDWTIWYDLAITSAGSERSRAFRRAESLNPLSDVLAVLRKRGYGTP